MDKIKIGLLINTLNHNIKYLFSIVVKFEYNTIKYIIIILSFSHLFLNIIFLVYNFNQPYIPNNIGTYYIPNNLSKINIYIKNIFI